MEWTGKIYLESKIMRRHFLPLNTAASLVIGLSITPITQATPLNDTGIDFCRDLATGADTSVTPGVTCQPLPAHGAQDARYGRDAAAVKGILPKVGGSAGSVSGNPNGFDFTKISNGGAVLPANASLGGGANDWACTYDNNTGLMWEVKVDSPTHLRHKAHTYTWYDSVHSYDYGPGMEDTLGDGGVCQTDGRCDIEKFVADVNATGLCGHADWRMPTIQELNTIVDQGRERPAIDPVYFPNTPETVFWSSTPYAGPLLPAPGSTDRPSAWGVHFYNGHDVTAYLVKSFAYTPYLASPVRLVRAGQ